MNLDRLRAMLLTLPHVSETLQWGEKVVFWVGPRGDGGRMFSIADLDPSARFVLAFAAGPERAANLCEMDGISPAPYLARAHWVAAERWTSFSSQQWKEELLEAHAYVWRRLPARTRAQLPLFLAGQPSDAGQVGVKVPPDRVPAAKRVAGPVPGSSRKANKSSGDK